MLLADLGAEVIKVEGPKGDDTRTWQPPVRDGVATYYLGVNRNKRSIALDFARPGRPAVAPELAARADIVIENFRPGGLARFGLDYDAVAAGNPDRLRLDQRLRQRREGRAAARLRPDGPGHLRADEPDRRPGRPAVPGGHLGVRRDGRAARDHRRAGRAAQAPRDRRGQHVEVNLLSSALSGLVNHSSAYVAGGTVPYRMGNSHPSLFPYEPLPCADGDLIITAGNDGQFRKLCAVLGLPELADDPRFAHNQDRTANRDALRPLLVERLATRTKHEWFRTSSPPGCRADRSTPSTPGWRSRRRSAWTRWSRSAEGHAVPSVRHPISFSESAGRVPAAAARAGRARRRDPRLAGERAFRRGTTDPRSDEPQFPTSLGTSDADHIRLLGQDLAADLMGKVGFGELAFWLVTLRRPTSGEVRVFEAVLVALADHGFTPTAIAARLTYLSAPDSLQGALAAGLLGGGSRFLGVTEDCGQYLNEVLEAQDQLPSDDAGWDALALEAVRATKAAGRFVPGSATRCTRPGTRVRRS